MNPKRGTWQCPLCDEEAEYGQLGCDDPRQCPSEKNLHFNRYFGGEVPAASEEPGIGISEIANGEDNEH
jgi:hypothetical protein